MVGMDECPERLDHALQECRRRQRLRAKDITSSARAEVYVIKCNDCIKVGISAESGARLSFMQVGNPYKLVLVGGWIADNPEQEEALIHAILGKYHVRGEWFRPPEAILLNILQAKPANLRQTILGVD